MSWKSSRALYGPRWCDLHIFTHALDPKQRVFYELNVNRFAWSWQIWPPKSVLDYENEWTLQTEQEYLQLIEWAMERILAERKRA